MQLGHESGALAHTSQDVEDQSVVGRVDIGEQRRLELRRHLFGTRQELESRLREMDRVGSPVRGVTPTFDEAAFLEVVDQADHDVAVHADVLGELLLGLALVAGDPDQHAEVGRTHPERL